MRRRLPAIAGALFVVLVTLSLLLRGDSRELTPTSYGVDPGGFGALHDVLVELDIPVRRSFAPPGELPAGETVWWIEPYDVCEKLRAPEEAGPARAQRGRAAGAPSQAGLERWLRGGGTAVWFSSQLARCEEPVRIAGLALPASADPVSEMVEDAVKASEEALGFPVEDQPEPVSITGPLVPRPRRLPEAPRTYAVVPEPFRVVARAGGDALAVEAPVGEGRLVLVADAYFLRNAWLDLDDSALLVLDWVRAYGVPILDEREHDLRDTPSTLPYLAASPALPVFAGLGATGLLFAWAGASLPRRRVGEVTPDPPTLASYVDSLARLYARTGEHAEVYERYRAFALAELRRVLVLPHDAPVQRVRDALQARGVTEAQTSALRDPARVRQRAELDAACAALDRLLSGVG